MTLNGIRRNGRNSIIGKRSVIHPRTRNIDPAANESADGMTYAHTWFRLCCSVCVKRCRSDWSVNVIGRWLILSFWLDCQRCSMDRCLIAHLTHPTNDPSTPAGRHVFCFLSLILPAKIVGRNWTVKSTAFCRSRSPRNNRHTFKWKYFMKWSVNSTQKFEWLKYLNWSLAHVSKWDAGCWEAVERERSLWMKKHFNDEDIPFIPLPFRWWNPRVI